MAAGRCPCGDPRCLLWAPRPADGWAAGWCAGCYPQAVARHCDRAASRKAAVTDMPGFARGGIIPASHAASGDSLPAFLDRTHYIPAAVQREMVAGLDRQRP